MDGEGWSATNSNPGETPVRRGRAYRWLSEAFEMRSVAEMSIHFCIVATVLFFGALFLALAISGSADTDPPPSDARIATGMLTSFGLWLAFLLWLGFSFVRIARRWGPERLGTPIFKLLQRAWLIMTGLMVLAQGIDQFDIFLLSLIVFDVFLLEMVVVFLLIAWLARCKVPWQTYWDVGVIALVFVAQVILFRWPTW